MYDASLHRCNFFFAIHKPLAHCIGKKERRKELAVFGGGRGEGGVKRRKEGFSLIFST